MGSALRGRWFWWRHLRPLQMATYTPVGIKLHLANLHKVLPQPLACPQQA
jgi:hypothetical protein